MVRLCKGGGVFTVLIEQELFDALLYEAANAHPHECCGLLLGDSNQIQSIQPTSNTHPRPRTHFEIDPGALIAAHRAARKGGPEIVGYYHSHPVGAARPSKADQAHAAEDGRIWAILAGKEIQFWRDLPDGFVPLSYNVISQ